MVERIILLLGGKRMIEKIVFLLKFLLLLSFLLYVPGIRSVYADSPSPDVSEEAIIQLLSPEPGKLIVAKKPVIRCLINTKFSIENLLVLLDGNDITGALDISSHGFTFRPVQVLYSGEHTLSVELQREDGLYVKKEFSFSTRHTEAFEEASFDNNVSLMYETVLKKPDELTYIPDSKIQANLSSNEVIKEEEWKVSFTTNLRFLDQNTPLSPPEEKGLTLSDYLFNISYNKYPFEISSDIGHIQINETQNTIQYLARRGGRIKIRYKDFVVHTFVVNSAEVVGFRGGMGIEGTTDDHIMGASVEQGFSDNRIKLKMLYVAGGEKGSSLGIYTLGGNKKGEVWGGVISTDFFDNKLTVEAEVDFSEFDPDASDEFPAESDIAYRINIRGYIGVYNYNLIYEYMGPNYEVIGNPQLQKDRRGFSLNGGMSFKQHHSLNVSCSLYHDNVKKNELYPVIYTLQGGVNYSFSGISNLPITLGYQRSIIYSTKEPDPLYEVQTDTDTFSANVSYTKNMWNFTLQINHSIQNDKTVTDNDSTTTTYTFIPSYYGDNFSISTNFSFNRSTYLQTSMRIDTYTLNLDLRGKAYHQRISYELAGTYNYSRASDGSSEQYTLNTNFRTSCLLAKNLWGYLNPSVGVRGEYRKMHDMVYDQKSDELILLFVFTANIPFSL
jgi:hypothetical protein